MQAENEPKVGSNNPDKQTEDVYTGQAWHVYSHKIDGAIDLAQACNQLLKSKIFQLAFTSDGELAYLEGKKVKRCKLKIDINLTNTGMSVSGHQEFISANPKNSALLSFRSALDLHLSRLKLFSDGFEFPPCSVRAYMYPMFIKCAEEDRYKAYLPYLTLYSNGIMQLTFSDVLGFSDLSVREIVRSAVNKSSLNVVSILASESLLAAICKFSETHTPLDFLASGVLSRQRKSWIEGHRQEVEFLEETELVTELVHTKVMALSDVSCNIIDIAINEIFGDAKSAMGSWLTRRRKLPVTTGLWMGKPIIYIKEHSNQKESSAENRVAHKYLIDSVLSRIYQAQGATHSNPEYIDHRVLDDFNHFCEEQVSLLISSKKASRFFEAQHAYTFNNLVSDSQVLSELAQYIGMYYRRAQDLVDSCSTAIDVARVSLAVANFEASLIASRRSGEVAKMVESFSDFPSNKHIRASLKNKIEVIGKAIELDDRIDSEVSNKRLTILFGIIASATLSPELIQPLGKMFNFYGLYDESVVKVASTAISFAGVFLLMKLIVAIPRKNKNKY